MKTFQYKRSFQVIHWGCCFDSLLELKYAIYIENDYEFMRAQIPIFFDPRTNKPTNYIRDNIRRYTPDFLIRDKQTKKAYLVEVKPRAFADQDQLKDRREIAENFIRWKGWDWEFKIVFDDEFELNEEQKKIFRQCCRMITESERKLNLKEINDKYCISAPTFFKKLPSGKQVHFIMYGT